MTDKDSNLIVPEAKIHNDASVDISEDGSLLVTLVPSNMPMQTLVGVFGLSVSNKGRKVATHGLEYPPVSVSISPTTKYLLVGYSTRSPRSRLAPYSSPAYSSLMAQIFYLQAPIANDHQTLQMNSAPNSENQLPSSAGNSNENAASPTENLLHKKRLVHQRDLHQNENGVVYLNCIRWIPVAGMGMVYATTTGTLKILR